MKTLKTFLTFFGMQCFQYAMCVMSWRAVAQANIPISLLIDTIFATMQWFIITKIIENKDNKWAPMGYIVGCTTGTYLGIIISKIILGQ